MTEQQTQLSSHQQQITDDLTSLLGILPIEISRNIEEINRNEELLEIVLDLGRKPTARYLDGEYMLLDREITEMDLEQAVMQIGDFDADNRAGIERTLHRISGIRNRRGDIVGLTCRVGRAVFGTIDIIGDIVTSGQSVLFLGRPGVGKTTMLREAARVLADSRRVVIVDTSNEIGGDGDIAHPAIGKARRMQVPTPNLQHEVMIEAVENHNPEVIVIDEIGRELEAQAARTIAERGVQLIGTAHGITLDNLMLNPTLSDLIGGIESVTLSDEEARRRGTQKTVLERRAPPTFDVLVELQDRDTLHVHMEIAEAVDISLRGREALPEIRRRAPGGKVDIEKPQKVDTSRRRHEAQSGQNNYRRQRNENGNYAGDPQPVREVQTTPADITPEQVMASAASVKHLAVYPYGIARNRLIEAARHFGVSLSVVESLNDADLLLTLKNFYRRRPRLVVDAEQRGVPIYVLRSNTIVQIESFIIDQYGIEEQNNDTQQDKAVREAHEAIQAIQRGAKSIDLAPQKASIRKVQHKIVRDAHLNSHSYGQEPERHVRVYRS